MNLTPLCDVFKPVIRLIEIIFEQHAPEVVAAAQAAGVAATEVAVASAEQDPKVQAALALYQAAQGLKAALNEPPKPGITPGPTVVS